MSLISCPECKREVSDQARACPHCGFPLSSAEAFSPSDTFKITISMAKQTFLLSATVTVVLNGKEVAWVGDGQTVAVETFGGENTLELSASTRKKTITFYATKDVAVTAKWNRLSGGLDVLCTGENFRQL